jgi:Holliday junction resolvasome RuvABC endonuclease subunit
MIIVSIDLGKTCGTSIRTNQGIEFEEEYEYRSLLQLHTYVKGLLSLWKPDLLLIPYPTRFYAVILAHGKMMGAIEAAAEFTNTPVINCQDSTCKKVVIGKGNAKKADIAKHYGEDVSEHILDARLFCDWYLKSI